MSTEAIIGTVLASLAAFFAGCAALIKWGIGKWDAAAKEGREAAEREQAANRSTADRSTQALIANTASNAVLVVKLDSVVTSNAELSRKIDGIGAFVEEHTPINQPFPRRIATPARGAPAGEYSHVPKRGTTNGDR